MKFLLQIYSFHFICYPILNSTSWHTTFWIYILRFSNCQVDCAQCRLKYSIWGCTRVIWNESSIFFCNVWVSATSITKITCDRLIFWSSIERFYFSCIHCAMSFYSEMDTCWRSNIFKCIWLTKTCISNNNIAISTSPITPIRCILFVLCSI